MPLKPIEPFVPFTIQPDEDGPQIVLAPLWTYGVPDDLPPPTVIVAYVTRCFEGVGPQVSSSLTLKERGRGALDSAATIYAKAAPGAPDEDRRRARSYVSFRQDWESYLHDVLAAIGGDATKIVLPVSTGKTVLQGLQILQNDYFTMQPIQIP